MSTDKIPNIAPALDEWCTALRWHPDLARDLREAAAMIPIERKRKRLRRQAASRWPIVALTRWPNQPVPRMPDDEWFPVFLAATWLRHRYNALWAQAPHMPERLTLEQALWGAVVAGSWATAASIIRGDVARYAARRHVIADTFANVHDVRVPDWVGASDADPLMRALLNSVPLDERTINSPSILLTMRDYATIDEAKRALDAAWTQIADQLPPQPGARVDQGSHGGPNFTQQVILYHLFRAWTWQRLRRGEKATQATFAKTLAAGRLSLQHPRAAHLLHTTSTVPDEIITWLTKDYPQSQEYVGKRLRDIIPVLGPDKKVRQLTDYLGPPAMNKDRDATQCP